MEIDYVYGKVNGLDPMTLEFVDYLKLLGIEALFSKYHGTNYLSIWVLSIDDVKKAKQIVKANFREIIDYFKSLLKKYNYPVSIDMGVWSNFSLSSIYSFEIDCINKLIRRCKQEIIKNINRKVKNKPEDVFCHSAEGQSYSIMPGYYFVYYDSKKLRLSSEGDQYIIKTICNSVLKNNDKTGFYDFEKIQISFHDTIGPAYIED